MEAIWLKLDCARGFEELHDFPTDFPCCSRIVVRSIFALIVSQNWILVFTGKRRTVKIGIKISSIDPGLFYWRENNTLIGIFACQVDNMIWWGNQHFKETVITILKKVFCFSPEEIKAFTYIGIG